MSRLRCSITMSLDGYIAGPNQSREKPLGERGEELHAWLFRTKTFRLLHGDAGGGETGIDDDVVREGFTNVGATIMGRNMFGPVRGPWRDEAWRGWWGETPPFHHPVFVLTHHGRAPLRMQGGTTFHFVTGGVAAALAQARAAAGGQDVAIGGGANVVQQYLAAGLLDELELHLVPCLLGGGARLFEHLGERTPTLVPMRCLAGAGVTHLKYRVGSDAGA